MYSRLQNIVIIYCQAQIIALTHCNHPPAMLLLFLSAVHNDSSMAARMGTQYLTKRLTALLLSHLQTYLPVIRQQILGTIQVRL